MVCLQNNALFIKFCFIPHDFKCCTFFFFGFIKWASSGKFVDNLKYQQLHTHLYYPSLCRMLNTSMYYDKCSKF